MITKIKKVFGRLRNFRIKRKIKKHEKVYCEGETRLKYYYVPHKKSDVLIVVFSGFPAKGKSAAYNMVATLEGVSANRLYILDDFGYQNRGAYYLGENGEFSVRDAVLNFLKTFASHKTVFCGSSKGGTAAIYFGLLFGADYVIAGAPQYYLGDYLTSEEAHVPIFEAMAGSVDPISIEKYNNILPKSIVSACHSAKKPRFLIHYSPEEHTYPSHIFHMLNDLQQYEFVVEHDVQHYEKHSDVALYFPKLCREKILSILNENA